MVILFLKLIKNVLNNINLTIFFPIYRGDLNDVWQMNCIITELL